AGYLGIVFFFVLSGFVLTYTAREDDTTRRFYRRRAFKILPNHVVAFVLALGVLVWAGRETDLTRVLTNLFLVQSWFPDETIITDTVNVVTWSLSAEVFFYACFPALILLVRRFRPERLYFWAAGLVGAIVLVPVIAGTVLPDAPDMGFGTETFTQIWSVYFFPVSRALEFVLGMVLARLVLTGRWRGPGLVVSALLVVGAYALSLQVPLLFQFVAVMVVPVALLIPAGARADVAGRRTVLSTGPMVWLGEISYAFFLLHYLVLSAGRLVMGGEPNEMGGIGGPAWSTPVGIAFLLGCMGVAVLLSWVLYTTVERPVMRRWSRPRRRPAADRAVPSEQLQPAE
ncbi:MAG TPA: acyltransferase, partial [Micromonosporaceae bacterium]|nr:acyltransferase [Micromonosporaceae bacterium]